MKAIAVIPARLASTRLPRKMLREIAGKPLIGVVYEAVRSSALLTDVIVATDSEEIMSACRTHGWKSQMTSATHRSGTERVQEISGREPADVYINVQGDEPLVDPAAIGELVEPFVDPSVQMTTLYRRIHDSADLANPNIAKVVLDRGGYAMYFSRAPIPYMRDPRGGWPPIYRHIGLYGYRRSTLLVLAALEQTPLERAEALEQLRALEHGIRIKAVETKYESFEVNTPEDLEQVRRLLAVPTSS